jgi:hypothetical protein
MIIHPKREFYCTERRLEETQSIGPDIAQAVSRRLPIAAARVRSYRICDGQSGTGSGFLRVLRFSLPIRIPLIAAQSLSSSIICGWYNRPVSGRSTKRTHVQSQPMRKRPKVYMERVFLSVVFLLLLFGL